MAGRTLTQHAVPITFGLKAAQWLQGVLDARDDLRGPDASRSRSAVPPAPWRRSTSSPGIADAAQFLVGRRRPARSASTTCAALAHQPRTLHPVRRRAGAGHRRLGHIANDVLAARPARDRRAGRAGRRGPGRVLDDAAEGQPGALRADPPRRPRGPGPRGPAAPRGRRRRSTSARRRLAHRVVDAGHAVPPHAGRPPRRPPSCSRGCTSTPARMAAVVKQQTSALLAEQRSLASRCRRPSARPTSTPATTSAPPRRSSTRCSPAPDDQETP